MRNAKKHPFIPPSFPLFIKQIDFNEKVVSNVTSETTFSLKSIYLMKREDERGIHQILLFH
jgi:choline kinase